MSSFNILERSQPLQKRLFLEASAGTGKTFTIEHLVVRLLLETDIALEQILVVTFTRAATRELKVRIRGNLEKSSEEKTKEALLTFEKAQIFTIHGFCKRLLQEFALEAHVGLDLQEWEPREERWAVLEFLRSTDQLYPQQLKRLLGSYRNDIDLLIEKLVSSSEEATTEDLLEKTNQNLVPFFPVSEIFTEIKAHYKGMTSSDFPAQAELLEQALQRGKILPEEWDQLIGAEDLFLEGIKPGNLKARTKFTGHALMDELRMAVLPLLEEARNPRKILQILAHAWQVERKRLSRLQEKIVPDDLLKMVEGRLGDQKFVEEVRKKYRAVIVDEFQDTDPVQWKIFEKLFFDDPSKSIYLVGDPKQSIYAFRKADVYTFLQAGKGFEQKAALTTNYRATQGLIESLNRLLCTKPWIDLPRLERQLEVPPAIAAKAGDGELIFMIGEGETAKRWPSLEVEHQFFSYIVQEIQDLKLDETAILVKDRYQALRVKNFLHRWNIPSVLSKSGSLGESLMIDLLEELIEATHGADPHSSIRKVLLGPFVQLPIEELTDEVLLEARAIFAELAESWRRLGFASFLAQFLQTRFGKATVLQALEETLYDDLMQIVEKLLYIQDPHQMAQELRLLKIQEAEDRISAHPHGVQIMTIHASKGLEFETVFALGLASRTPAEDKSENELKELDAEKMRQFYVALTRAKSRLYIPIANELDGKPVNLGEASPVELFLEKTSPDITAFSHVHLNRLSFDLKQRFESTPALIPPPYRSLYFKPFFLQSFTSLAQTAIEKKVVGDQILPPGSETGIILHAVLEKLFSGSNFLLSQEIQGTHLEGYEAVIQTMIDQVLDLPLEGFKLRDIDLSKAMPEMEFLFPASGSSLKGFIDLCFEHNGKYYLVDWKTNVLENYSLTALEEAMAQHDYFLQGKIYATALKRYLKLYGELQFGGVFFIFVRGPAAYHCTPEVFDV